MEDWRRVIVFKDKKLFIEMFLQVNRLKREYIKSLFGHQFQYF